MAQRVAGWLAAAAGAAFFLAPAAHAADLLLKRVVLSTGGVGYFEYAAEVTGDATLALEVPLDQVDDVLKSLVVYDAAGSAGEITLPGRQPLARSFADLPFDRAALASEVALLNALQGAEIRVAAPRPISGRLLHAERETVPGPGGTPETRARVSVLTNKGLEEFALGDVDAVAFADPQLQRQVATALRRIALYRTTGRRRLELQVSGSGTRTVRVGYVVAVPLWKASYRLILPADPAAESARLQGWAVLENFSGHAWRDVALTLLSGNPVTFRQALYESYWVNRPSVPVESGSHVLPPPDTGTVAARMAAKARPVAPRFGALALPEAAAAAAPPPLARIAAATAAEEATQIAFTPPYKVSVAAGQSLVLPLIDRALPAHRVDLYQPSVAPRHPLAAVRLTNASGSGLPPGVLTLYREDAKEGAVYLGDARLAPVPPGDTRLLSYAVDGTVTIDRTTSQRRPVVKATIAEGVLHLTRADRWTTLYRIKSVAQPPPALLIEEPRRSGARLTQPDPKTVELTRNAYRIPVTLPAGGAGAITVVEEEPLVEAVRLLDVDDNRLGVLAASDELTPKLRQALQGVAERRRNVARQRAALAQLRERRARRVADETRLREDIAAVGGDPTLKKRLIDRFTATESAIEADRAAISKAEDALAAAERDLNAYVAGLTL
jgi:hypothetical protein